jgi:PAS domain-containing protein
MRFKLAFGWASDDLFFVTTRREDQAGDGAGNRSKVTTYPHEDDFLKLVMEAGLGEEDTALLAAAVLVSVVRPIHPPAWTDLDLTQRQLERLQLFGPAAYADSVAAVGVEGGTDLYLQASRSGSLPQFYDLLMQAPTPIAMLVGPEHRFVFLNNWFAAMIQVSSGATLLGRTMEEAFPELRVQRFIEILDRVYATGEPWTGKEVPTTFHRETSGRFDEGYFDTIYQPIVNAAGEVAGIMIQSTEVTEMVLAREVREYREQLLFRQWAELESIYRNAPIGLLLLEPKEFRILRLNERQAEIIGASVAELLGVPVMSAAYETTGVREVFAAVTAGKSFVNEVFEGRLAASPDVLRRWLVSVAPVYGATGQVEAITLVSQELPAGIAQGEQSSSGMGLAMAASE